MPAPITTTRCDPGSSWARAVAVTVGPLSWSRSPVVIYQMHVSPVNARELILSAAATDPPGRGLTVVSPGGPAPGGAETCGGEPDASADAAGVLGVHLP